MRGNDTKATSGAKLVFGLPFLKVCDEMQFPHSKNGSLPPETAKAQAKTTPNINVRSLTGFGLSGSYRTPNEILNQLVMQEILAGRPVVVGTQFPSPPDNPDLGAKTQPRKRMAHMVVITGFKTETGSYKNTTYEFLNSWGTEWGTQGYGTMPATWYAPEMFSFRTQ